MAYGSTLWERIIAYTELSATLTYPLQISEAFGYSAALAGYLWMEFGSVESYLEFFKWQVLLLCMHLSVTGAHMQPPLLM